MGRKLPETITEKELLSIIQVTKKNNHKLAFLLGFYQCMRISEIVKLKPENIDINQRMIRIKQAKGGKDRNIPIMPEIIKKLHYLPIGCNSRALEYAFNKYYKKAGINKDLHFHSLRHSGATWLLNVKKWDIRHIQQFLGHAKISTTEIYAHVTADDLIELVWGDTNAKITKN